MRMFRPEDRGVNLAVRLDANLAQRLDEALAKNEMKCTLTPISPCLAASGYFCKST